MFSTIRRSIIEAGREVQVPWGQDKELDVDQAKQVLKYELCTIQPS